MLSELIEYYRFDDLETGILMNGKKYILSRNDLPVRQVSTPVAQIELLRSLHKNLRYNSNVLRQEKWLAIKSFSDTIKPFFIDVKSISNDEIQLDLVLNAAELGLLPFELLLDENDAPLFASEDTKLLLTRRIRQSLINREEIWPQKPKVLFAWANPNYGTFAEVPYKDHLNALEWALRPWGGKENLNVLKVIENTSFKALTEALLNADKQGKPFTHVHILAHGQLIFDKENPGDYEYGIAFVSKDEAPTKIGEIRNLFENKELKQKPFFVNYMICDGANFSNPLKSDKNPVQVTHRAGVPIVLGSQFPLSTIGSTIITETLYYQLFRGIDIRESMLEIRKKLYQNNRDNHDWISLVSYVRLPEGYEDYLTELSAQVKLVEIKSTQERIYNTIQKDRPYKDDFLAHKYDLDNYIQELVLLKEKTENGKVQIKSELSGLIGSVYKRIAELQFYMSSKIDQDSKKSIDKQIEFLQEALVNYQVASDKNLSHHWSITQFLSLDVVLNKSITNMDYWYAARQAARNDARHTKEIWAFSTLIELYLLVDRNEYPEAEKEIEVALDQLIRRANRNNDSYPLHSTLQQFSRYVNWWIKDHGYNINDELLISNNKFMINIVDKLEENLQPYYLKTRK